MINRKVITLSSSLVLGCCPVSENAPLMTVSGVFFYLAGGSRRVQGGDTPPLTVYSGGMSSLAQNSRSPSGLNLRVNYENILPKVRITRKAYYEYYT